jgi:AcrR family transcriptional regulator
VEAASLVASHPAVAPLLGPRNAAQRARLLDAMAQAVGERGYANTTVADAVRAAKVSRGTFYALFESKEDCFIEGYRYGADMLIALNEQAIVAAEAAGGAWDDLLRAGVRSYLATLSQHPLFARAHFLELPYAGEQAQREREVTLRRMADRLRDAFVLGLADHPELAVPDDDAMFLLSAGIEQLVCSRIRDGRLAELPQLEGTIMATVMAAFLGNRASPT